MVCARVCMCAGAEEGHLCLHGRGATNPSCLLKSMGTTGPAQEPSCTRLTGHVYVKKQTLQQCDRAPLVGNHHGNGQPPVHFPFPCS